jgi:hypothetical protein
MQNSLSVEKCRALLGILAVGKTDTQVKVLRDELEVVANQMFDHLQSRLRVDPEKIIDAAADVSGFPASTEEQLKRDAIERIRWIAYAHENPDDEDAH